MTNVDVKYKIFKTLLNRSAVQQEEDTPIKGLLLVGDFCVLEYSTGQSHFGEDLTRIYPAVHDGKRAWLRVDEWAPSENYCACGTQETVIHFIDGLEILLEENCFGHLWGTTDFMGLPHTLESKMTNLHEENYLYSEYCRIKQRLHYVASDLERITKEKDIEIKGLKDNLKYAIEDKKTFRAQAEYLDLENIDLKNQLIEKVGYYNRFKQPV